MGFWKFGLTFPRKVGQSSVFENQGCLTRATKKILLEQVWKIKF